jgi:adenine deaminase
LSLCHTRILHHRITRDLAAVAMGKKPLTGHYASTDLNAGLNAYIAAGMTADRETTTSQGAQARVHALMPPRSVTAAIICW